MKLKHTLLASASALVLFGAASSGALAGEQVEQNDSYGHFYWHIPETMDQVVSGEAHDYGSRRLNTLNGHYSNNLTGISHDQQNNGNNNAMAIETNVVANGSNPYHNGDVEQNLHLYGESSEGIYSDSSTYVPSADAFRRNVIANAYQHIRGIIDVQQNNGDGNVMGIGDVVSANLGDLFGQNGAHTDDSSQKVLLKGVVNGNNTESLAYGYSSPITNERVNTINDKAFADFLGMASIQQNNGNGNVIQAGNAVIADLGTGSFTSSSERSRAQSVIAYGTVENNNAYASADAGPPPPNERTNFIGDALIAPKGIVNAQQNNGDNNVMNVANAVRASYATADDIDDTQRGAVWAKGKVLNNNQAFNDDLYTNTDNNQDRRNTLTTNAFKDALGLMTVQQNNGNNNAMNSATGIVATLYNTGDANGNDAAVFAKASAEVTGNVAVQTENVDRVNVINGNVFNNAKGVATVQQNNGDNNVINASKSIVAAVGSDGSFVGFNGDIASDTVISATVTGNYADIAPTSGAPGYQNTLTNSFQGFAGVKSVQQNNGSNNAMQSAISVVANINTGPF
jgi:hypothetical protein